MRHLTYFNLSKGLNFNPLDIQDQGIPDLATEYLHICTRLISKRATCSYRSKDMIVFFDEANSIQLIFMEKLNGKLNSFSNTLTLNDVY